MREAENVAGKATMAKALCAVAMSTVAAFGALADEGAYSFVNKGSGCSYIQINKDLDSFSFTSDFKSIGNSGRVGYVVYTSDLGDHELADYMKKNAGGAEFAKKKNGGLVDLGALKAGDRVGFYLERNNGHTVFSSAFMTQHGQDYLGFAKNFGGKDEWMSIQDIKAVRRVPAGAPLPGFLAALLVGGAGAGAMKLRRRRG